MSEKTKYIGIYKLEKHFKGKFYRNFIARLVRNMTMKGDIKWERYRGLTTDDARIVIQKLVDLKSGDLRLVNPSGLRYIKTPENSFSKPKRGMIAEHRHVIEQNLGRKLGRNEYVYHINGDIRDNRIENLLLCESIKKLKDVKNSMGELIPILWQNGALEFNFETKKYEISDEFLH